MGFILLLKWDIKKLMTWKYVHDKCVVQLYPWFVLNYNIIEKSKGIAQENVDNDYLGVLWDSEWFYFFNLFYTSQHFFNEYGSFQNWANVNVVWELVEITGQHAVIY